MKVFMLHRSLPTSAEPIVRIGRLLPQLDHQRAARAANERRDVVHALRAEEQAVARRVGVVFKRVSTKSFIQYRY